MESGASGRRPHPTTRVSRQTVHWEWDASVAPVVSVDPGSVVAFDCIDSSHGQITRTSVVADLGRLDFTRVDAVSGPVLVNGAKPGDTLQIDLLAFEPGPWGWTAVIPGFGLLAADFPQPALRISTVPERGQIEFLPGAHVRREPFCGAIGVAPAAGPLPAIPPDLHGGNMDTRHLVAGSSLFLPVFHDGALLSIGDGHAAQGDGEVCGTAIETSMHAVVRVSVRHDMSIEAPRFIAPPEAPDLGGGRRFATHGIGPDLLQAARDSVRRMIDWLGHDFHVDPIDAYMLCSVAADLRISEIVDAPNHIVTTYVPLDTFG